MDLIAVGDVMIDVRVDAGALVRGGDVHGRVRLQPGGTSANAAVWAAHEGASARVHGRVGDDVASSLLRDALIQRGVETAFAVAPGEATGTMLVMYEAGERSMVADRGANAHLAPTDLPPRLSAGAVLVSGYLFLHDDGHDAAVAALARADAEWVAIEAASWPLIDAFGATRFFEEAGGATMVLANDREAEALTGERGERAASMLGERYRAVAVKMGAGGSLLVIEGRLYRQRGETIDELDPTGAGDAFDGVLLAGLARGREPADALSRACHAGALVAASTGAWPERAA